MTYTIYIEIYRDTGTKKEPSAETAAAIPKGDVIMSKKTRDFNFVPPASANKSVNKKMSFAEASMINVGALVVYMASYGLSKAAENAVKLVKQIRRSAVPMRRGFSPAVIKNHFKSFFGGFAATGKCIAGSTRKFGERVKTAGLRTALKLQLSDIYSAVKRNKSVFFTMINYAVPVASFAVLAGVVYSTASTSYGITVEYNGQELGVVTAESVVAEAQQTIADRSVYYDVSDEIFVTANLSIKPLNALDEVIDEVALADKIEEQIEASAPEAESSLPADLQANEITPEPAGESAGSAEENTAEDITAADTASDESLNKVRAFAVEVDGELIGAVEDTSEIEAFLESKKSEYDSEDVISVDFDKDIEYGYEQYVDPEQLVSQDDIVNKLDSIVSEPVYYEIRNGDNPWDIAKANDMTVDELKNCFITFEGEVISDITEFCPVGATIQLSAEVPYLQPMVTKEVTYTDIIDYETITTQDPDMYKGDSQIDVPGVEGEAEYTALITYKNNVPVSTDIINEVVLKNPVTQEMRVGTRETTTEVSTGSGGSGEYFWPVDGGYISSYMGDGRGHKGLDIAAPYGTPIYACESGTVTRAGNKADGYGNSVMVAHDDGNETMYAHMSSIAISYGDYVVKGQLLGYVGSTGDSTGNHLHLEVRSGGYYLNPSDFVSQY